ncbi:hypothetical protein KCU65_g148, partial [Aureobasidium melanogenum]
MTTKSYENDNFWIDVLLSLVMNSRLSLVLALLFLDYTQHFGKDFDGWGIFFLQSVLFICYPAPLFLFSHPHAFLVSQIAAMNEGSRRGCYCFRLGRETPKVETPPSDGAKKIMSPRYPSSLPCHLLNPIFLFNKTPKRHRYSTSVRNSLRRAKNKKRGTYSHKRSGETNANYANGVGAIRTRTLAAKHTDQSCHGVVFCPLITSSDEEISLHCCNGVMAQLNEALLFLTIEYCFVGINIFWLNMTPMKDLATLVYAFLLLLLREEYKRDRHV